ncbi:MAG: glycosyltransferase [Bacteroidetes bacterium]|nr:MAG: glycosyltransferase [Bacteroidota bacterium]
MHVLFLNSWYPNRNAPTLGNFVEKHAEAAALFHTISCLSIFPSEKIKHMEIGTSEKNGVFEVQIYIPQTKASIPFIGQLIKWWNYRKAFKAGLTIIEKKKGAIDLTHLNVVYPLGIFALKLKRKYNIPFVVTEHSTGYHDPSNKFTKRQLDLTKKVLQSADLILPVSNDLGKAISRLAPATKQIRVTNVVDANVFKLNVENRRAFIHISTLNEEQKNPKGIIDVLAELKTQGETIPFLFISDMPFEQLKNYAAEKGLNENDVTFKGPLSTNEIANELAHARALVLFSNYENFPCVIAESFMSGVPVISTNVNGIPEFVNPQNGILIEAQDKEALKEAFLTFLQREKEFEPEKLRSFALENFSYEAIGKAFSDIYLELKSNAR